MEKASEIFANIKTLGSDKERREELSDYCNANIEQILQHLPRRILRSDGEYILEYIFCGLPDKIKSMIVDKVLHKIRSEPMSITQCGNLISRVCPELRRLPIEDLVRWSTDSVQTVVEDSDVNMIWKDILPECLYIVSSHDHIKHCGTEMSGEEFKIQCIHTLCQCRWTERQLVQLAAMFKEMQLSRAELKQVVNKLCSYIVDLPPDTLPAVVHQLLKLCKVDNLEIVLSHLSNYFNLKLYNTLEPPQHDSESTTIDVDDIGPPERTVQPTSQCTEDGTSATHKSAHHGRSAFAHDRVEVIHTSIRKHCRRAAAPWHPQHRPQHIVVLNAQGAVAPLRIVRPQAARVK